MGIIATILNPVFSPLLTLGSVYAIICMAIIINMISSSLTRVFVDTKKMKELQEEMKGCRKGMMGAAKLAASDNPEDKQKKKHAKRDEERMMELQSELMKMQFPMFFTIVPIIFVFMWMRATFADIGVVINLPFAFPYFGSDLGWLGWYIFSSMPFAVLIRKLMRVA